MSFERNNNDKLYHNQLTNGTEMESSSSSSNNLQEELLVDDTPSSIEMSYSHEQLTDVSTSSLIDLTDFNAKRPMVDESLCEFMLLEQKVNHEDELENYKKDIESHRAIMEDLSKHREMLQNELQKAKKREIYSNRMCQKMVSQVEEMKVKLEYYIEETTVALTNAQLNTIDYQKKYHNQLSNNEDLRDQISLLEKELKSLKDGNNNGIMKLEQSLISDVSFINEFQLELSRISSELDMDTEMEKFMLHDSASNEMTTEPSKGSRIENSIQATKDHFQDDSQCDDENRKTSPEGFVRKDDTEAVNSCKLEIEKLQTQIIELQKKVMMSEKNHATVLNLFKYDISGIDFNRRDTLQTYSINDENLREIKELVIEKLQKIHNENEFLKCRIKELELAEKAVKVKNVEERLKKLNMDMNEMEIENRLLIERIQELSRNNEILQAELTQLVHERKKEQSNMTVTPENLENDIEQKKLNDLKQELRMMFDEHEVKRNSTNTVNLKKNECNLDNNSIENSRSADEIDEIVETTLQLETPSKSDSARCTQQ